MKEDEGQTKEVKANPYNKEKYWHKEELMPKKHSCLLQKMLHESQVLEDQINRFMIETEPKTFYIKGMKSQTSFWEFTFSNFRSNL